MDKPWTPHPNWDDSINEAFSRTDAEGGAYLDKLEVGKRLSVIVTDCVLTIERRTDGFWMQGHPKYCPEWTRAKIPGSTWGGSMIKLRYVGIGMRLEFYPESYEGKRIVSSQILDIKEESAL